MAVQKQDTIENKSYNIMFPYFPSAILEYTMHSDPISIHFYPFLGYLRTDWGDEHHHVQKAGLPVNLTCQLPNQWSNQVGDILRSINSQKNASQQNSAVSYRHQVPRPRFAQSQGTRRSDADSLHPKSD